MARALYIHWPFCLAKCPYCDFNSHVATAIDQRAWREALLREMEFFAARTQHRVLTSIFFGGGTPSLMDPNTTAEIIAAARRLVALAKESVEEASVSAERPARARARPRLTGSK